MLYGLFSITAATAEDVKIAALGDSLTQGYGLVAEDGFTQQLEKWLRTQEVAATIVNAGVSGDTSAGGLSRVEWTLTPDIDAMIVALGGNDILRGQSPELVRSNLSGILDAAAARRLPVLLVGISVPNNYGPEYADSFKAIYPDLAAEYGALYFEDFLAPLYEGRTRADVLSTLMQADGLHPNSEGVAIIVDTIGPQVAELAAQASAE